MIAATISVFSVVFKVDISPISASSSFIASTTFSLAVVVKLALSPKSSFNTLPWLALKGLKTSAVVKSSTISVIVTLSLANSLIEPSKVLALVITFNVCNPNSAFLTYSPKSCMWEFTTPVNFASISALVISLFFWAFAGACGSWLWS